MQSHVLKAIRAKLYNLHALAETPTITLHAYVRGEYNLLLDAGANAPLAAETYVRYAIDGTQGDCLELRVNGYRVPV